MAAKNNCFEIANYFIDIAHEFGSFISNLKLQKLIYYAQAWYLAMFDEQLFDDDFEAWVHGPVIYKLWKQYKKYSYNTITEEPGANNFDESVQNYLAEVTKVYFPYDAYELELMTHKEAPWIDARKGCAPDEPCRKIIPKESIKAYFKERLAQTN